MQVHLNVINDCNNNYKDMVTFTAVEKIYSTEYFCDTKVDGLGEIFIYQKFFVIQYLVLER